MKDFSGEEDFFEEIEKELFLDKEVLLQKADLLQKALAEKRHELEVHLQSLPKEEPLEKPAKEAYQRIEEKIEELKKNISTLQKELMEILKHQTDSDLQGE